MRGEHDDIKEYRAFMTAPEHCIADKTGRILQILKDYLEIAVLIYTIESTHGFYCHV